uniref:non-specific serine/threonine protein kinase n=1 Tax=Mucochytrium quahogii TaxID=96639 RepID=A0A7S2S4A0_9STRA|mmetsp:Transcript_24496/g.53069  ORF Transcript_24496/g.53069 Transcript_24496/m.53069 type:complete len:168 (+) Transcript_24496:327-830(+)
MGQTLRRCLGKSNAPHQNDFQSNLVRLDTNLDAYEENYIEGELLGEGITGCVKEVEHRKTGKKYAMKSINLDRVNKAQIKELKTEIEILKQLDHPNIVRLHEVYQNKSNIRIVMELLTGGDLSSRFLVDEEKIRNVVFQLVSACRYWHSRGVVHRDLKLENVLCTVT